MVGTPRCGVCLAQRARPHQHMKRYLITGASRGIGRAIAEKLAADDAMLLLHGRDTVALAQTCKAVEPHCAKVVLLVHDLAKPSAVSDLIAEAGKGTN
jgi:3-oxoacyl-[acyl-carrier protein] reductase